MQQWDAERDLDHVREGTDLPKLNLYPKELSAIPAKGKKLDSGRNPMGDGVLFVTYSLLMASSKDGPKLKLPGVSRRKKKGRERDEENEMSQEVAMDTMCRPGSRLHQIIEWLKGQKGGKDSAPVMVFDECHKAKNLNATGSAATCSKTALAVLALQRALPRARVMYCSATGASEPKSLQV